MYRVDKRAHRHKRAKRRLYIILGIIILGMVIYGLTRLRIAPTQNLHNSPPVSKSYAPTTTTMVHIDKPFFRLDLPNGWKEVPPGPGSTAPDYSFRSPSQQAQLLDIYLRVLPLNMALNKAVVVSAQGDGLSYDSVSDNCTTFTDATKAASGTKTVLSRWRGTDFICDVGNFARAVVGTVSTEGINQVTGVGPTTGSHKIFMTYTDNNINPDYSVLYAILGSIRFK